MNPLSGVLGEAWQLYRAHAGHLLPIAFVIYLVAGVIAAALLAVPTVLGGLAASIVQLIAIFMVQATLVKAVQDVRDGRAEPSFGGTISAAMPYLGRVAVASTLAGIAIAIGFTFFIVPGLYLLTIWSLIVPAIVIGQSGALASFGRSFGLVRGFAWRVFSTYVLAFLILLGVGIVISAILRAVPFLARNAISSIVSGTLVAPFIALVVTLIYYRLVAAHRHGPVQGARPGTY